VPLGDGLDQSVVDTHVLGECLQSLSAKLWVGYRDARLSAKESDRPIWNYLEGHVAMSCFRRAN
jgi:hypothetical protein